MDAQNAQSKSRLGIFILKNALDGAVKLL